MLNLSGGTGKKRIRKDFLRITRKLFNELLKFPLKAATGNSKFSGGGRFREMRCWECGLQELTHKGESTSSDDPSVTYRAKQGSIVEQATRKKPESFERRRQVKSDCRGSEKRRRALPKHLPADRGKGEFLMGRCRSMFLLLTRKKHEEEMIWS